MAAPKKRPITAEDLYAFQLVSDCQLAPDGRHVVYVQQRVEKEKEKKYSHLWVAPTGGGAARQFTVGDHSDYQPRWSPDGRQIAFLSNRGDEEQPQLYLIPFDGGEARRLTDLKGEFGEWAWSPDGRQLLCHFRQKDEETLAREKDEQKKKLGVVARHVHTFFYAQDGEGYLPQAKWHLWLIDARTGKGRPLTRGDQYDEGSAAWSPDGRTIAFCSNRTADPDRTLDAVDIYLMPAAGGGEESWRKVDTPYGPKSSLAFSPDGRWLAYVLHAPSDGWWRNDSLWVAPVASDQSLITNDQLPTTNDHTLNLTSAYDLQIANASLGDLGARTFSRPVWSKDGKSLYCQGSRHGRTWVYQVGLDGQGLRPVVDDDGVVDSFSLDSGQERLAYLLTTCQSPPEVWLCDLGRGRSRQLSQANGRLLRTLDLGVVEEVWFKGAAGNNLQGWIVQPPGFDPSQKYPSILEIHGGPWLQYGAAFMHEFYYLAAQGYVVAFCNPRGGQGYGEEHARAIWNQWGTVDYEDVMVWADYVAGLPYVDSTRMGVTGGSYGGFMTNWIIGHTDRFRAAVTQRSVSNLISMWGTSDFNWVFQQPLGDSLPPWQNFEKYWQHSPLKYVGNVKTPTLVIHSEQDLRAPMEQGQQLYVALKMAGVETELVLFPNESHGLSRGGRTDRRVERLKRISGWFDHYLKRET
ncbi:MAG: S9 family peptidase [Chloroflexota bacterium]